MQIETLTNLGLLERISIDYDSGDTDNEFVKILNMMECWQYEGRYNFSSIPIRIHSQNPVGVENMRRIIKRNGWTEVK